MNKTVTKRHYALQILVLLGITGLCGSLAQAQPDATEPRVTLPAEHWAYDTLEPMYQFNIIVGCSLFLPKNDVRMTRYEFAVSTLRFCERYDVEIADKFDATRPVGTAGYEDMVAALKMEFAPEIELILKPSDTK